MAERAPGRRTFGRTVVLGLAAAVVGAVAGAKPWAAVPGLVGDPLGTITSAGEAPLALALALVVLAAWGVVLATRGAVRRWVALLALVASLGLVAVVVHGAFTLTDQVAAAARESGVSNAGDAGLTAWFWVCAVCAVCSVVATAVAVREAPGWPSMGSRYDAPGSQEPRQRADQVEEIDLWKSMDEGRDPTS